MPDAVAEQVLSAIAEAKSVPVEQIDQSKTLADLQIDSLDLVTLAFELEDKFQISIPQESFRAIRTVGDIVEGIHALQARQRNPSSAAAS